MKLNRNFITPFLTFIFLSVGLSGVLMFLHLGDGFTEVLHEIMGLAFLLFAALHVVINWKSMKSYFGKKYFIIAPIVVFVLSLGLIALERIQPPVDLIVIDRFVKAPISDSFKLLHIDYEKAAKMLDEKGLKIEGAKTIEEIWIINDSSPKEIVEILVYESRRE